MTNASIRTEQTVGPSTDETAQTHTAQPHTPPTHIWCAASYAANGRFVATLGSAVVDLLAPQPGERILDLGCGDGALTQTLAAIGAEVVGLDPSPAMVDAARARGLEVKLAGATSMLFRSEFDAVFSNAALHWIPAHDQPAALASVARALRPGGRFVAEMGGLGNIAAIRAALASVLAPLGVDAEQAAASFFPSPAQYQRLLEAAGFLVESIALHPRPTTLPGGPEGMALWLETFRGGVLTSLSADLRACAIEDTTALLRPILADDTGQWSADYVRLRFRCTLPHTYSS